MAGSLTECSACGSALLVPSANQSIIRHRSGVSRGGSLRLFFSFFFTSAWFILFPVGYWYRHHLLPRRRLYAWRLAILGGTFLSALGALAGATGICRTEYKARPWEQAIMIGF